MELLVEKNLFMLPIAILAEIAFGYLKCRDYIKLDLVSKFFRLNIAKKLTSIDYREDTTVGRKKFHLCDGMLIYIAKVFPNIRSLSYKVQRSTGDGYWDSSVIGIIELIYLCKDLETVDFSLTFFDDVSHDIWRQSNYFDSGHFKDLMYLGLHGCTNLDDDNLRDLCFNIRALITLDIGDCQGFTDSGLTWLAACQSNLEHLDIGNQEVFREPQYYFNDVECTRELRFGNYGLQALSKGCKKLKSLILRNNLPLVSHEDMEEADGDCWFGLRSIIANCRDLELLDISVDNPKVAFKTEEEFQRGVWRYIRYFRYDLVKEIFGLPNLTILHLGGMSTRPQDWPKFRQLAVLRSNKLKWVGLQQTSLVKVGSPSETGTLRNTTWTSRHFDLPGSHWSFEEQTPFSICQFEEDLAFHICYGFHNHERNKNKRWLEWPVIPTPMKTITNDY